MWVSGSRVTACDPLFTLVLVCCLAKRKHTINRRVKNRLEQLQNRYRTISPFCSCVCEGGSWNGKSGAEAVFVYATKSQRATWQSQRLRLCRSIKSRTRATKSRDKIAGVTSVLERDSLTSWKQGLAYLQVCRRRCTQSGSRILGVSASRTVYWRQCWPRWLRLHPSWRSLPLPSNATLLFAILCGLTTTHDRRGMSCAK